ncbi:MAG: flagellar biosynthesis protein FlhF [Alphaproteobacteria bacterium]|jgi:flagellar biosynthesis protein FlhF
MHLQRFTAKTMSDAMAMITAELGEDAVMLANRRIEGPNGEDLLEVTAAVDMPKEADAGRIEEARPRKVFEKIPDNFPEIGRDASDLQKLLDKHGILPNISKKIDNAVIALSDAGFDDLGTLDLILAKMIPFEAPAKTLAKGKTHIFIGPTGAGKSTTICKLAAAKKIDRHSIALTTMDNQKMGGFEQMAIFAHALSEEALLIRGEEDWHNAKDALANKDYLFIDTPGINAFNSEQVNHLKKRIEALNITNKAVHLVLPATLNPLEMAAIPAAMAPLHPESILFTKFDETTYLGGLTNVAITSGLKVCFVTDGTNVPDDIVELDASMLAEKLMRKPRLPWEREV